MDLSQMSVDEFMKADWGSEESDEGGVEEPNLTGKEKRNDNQKKLKKKKKTLKDKSITAAFKPETVVSDTVGKKAAAKKSSSHQTSLDRLKEKDPEFYDFLQQEESGLLNFDEEGFDLDAPSDEENEGESGVHQLPDKLEEASDSDIEYGSDVLPSDSDGEAAETTSEKRKKKQQITVTEAIVEKWKDKLTEEVPTISTLRNVTRAFHAAIARFSQDDTDKTKKKKRQLNFKVENSSAFNAIVGLCIRQIVPSLAKILNYYPEKTSKKQSLPTQCKSWSKVRELLRTYLADVIELNQLLLEPSVVCATLRHTILLMPYFVSFPKITKPLLKFLVKSWSSADDESVRVLAFLCINRVVKLDTKRYLQQVLKQTYLAYVANCKFTSPTLLPMINFMQQTLCELFAIHPVTTYQLSFLYIRQLAIHLRKAMTIHKKENYQAVYNWQYVHCLGLWCRMVGSLYSDDSIKPLLYPLVQVCLGTIDLVPTPRYFPLRYHIIRYLTALSNTTNVYIPLLPYITRPLRLAEFSKKKGGTSVKPIGFSTILKLSNSQLKEASYRASTMDELYFALMEYVNTQAHTISFPEMMVPTMISLKKFAKNCKVPAYVKLARQVVDKVDENSKFILEKRSNVSFAVTDTKAVVSWESTLKEQGVPFHKHHAYYKKLHHRETQQAVADKNRIVEERLPMIDRKKFMELSKKRDKEELGRLFADDADDLVEDIEVNLENLVEQGKLARKNVKMKEKQNQGDSSDDEINDGVSSDEDIGSDNASTDGEESVDEEQAAAGKKRPGFDKDDDTTPTKLSKIEENEDPDIVEDFQFSSDDD